jgi:hypothetical protein
VDLEALGEAVVDVEETLEVKGPSQLGSSKPRMMAMCDDDHVGDPVFLVGVCEFLGVL